MNHDAFMRVLVTRTRLLRDKMKIARKAWRDPETRDRAHELMREAHTLAALIEKDVLFIAETMRK